MNSLKPEATQNIQESVWVLGREIENPATDRLETRRQWYVNYAPNARSPEIWPASLSSQLV